MEKERPIVAAITSSPWKRESWRSQMGALGYRAAVIPVPIGVAEPDMQCPEETAKGKLANFLVVPNVQSRLGRVRAGSATVIDILWTDPDGKVLTTDRDGEGFGKISKAGDELYAFSDGGRKPVEIRTVCTTGTVKETWDSEVFVSFDSTVLRLYPGIIALMRDVERLVKLVEEGVIPGDTLTPRSIMGINWVKFISFVPMIAKKAGYDCVVELGSSGPGSHQNYYLHERTPQRVVDQATNCLNNLARGIPSSVAKQIVEYLT